MDAAAGGPFHSQPCSRRCSQLFSWLRSWIRNVARFASRGSHFSHYQRQHSGRAFARSQGLSAMQAVCSWLQSFRDVETLQPAAG